MGVPMDLTNIYVIPTWGLVALALTVLGGLVAALVGFRSRRAPAWALALVPVAGVAAFAAASAPENMVTLSVALTSMALALAMLLTGTFGLTPSQSREDRDDAE